MITAEEARALSAVGPSDFYRPIIERAIKEAAQDGRREARYCFDENAADVTEAMVAPLIGELEENGFKVTLRHQWCANALAAIFVEWEAPQ